MRGGGSKAVWIFSKNSSDLVAGPFPKELIYESRSYRKQLKPCHIFKDEGGGEHEDVDDNIR